MSVPYAEVIGDPIAHSKSPLIHKFWLEKLGLPGDYRAVRVTADELGDYLALRRNDPDWRGCNVTMPHKERMLSLIDRLHDRGVGAVNCVVPLSGWLEGHNTDIDGVSAVLGDEFKKGMRLAHPIGMIGSGGAARAAIIALKQICRFEAHLISRNRGKALQLLMELGVGGETWEFDEAGPALENCVALVNASPLGMAGGPSMPANILDAVRSLHPDAMVFDMVYSPSRTQLLKRASESGLEYVFGLDMLVGQARASFEHFFGLAVPDDYDGELQDILTQ